MNPLSSAAPSTPIDMNSPHEKQEVRYVQARPTRLTGIERKKFNSKLRSCVWVATICSLPPIALSIFKLNDPFKSQILIGCGGYLFIVWACYFILKKPRAPKLKS